MSLIRMLCPVVSWSTAASHAIASATAGVIRRSATATANTIRTRTVLRPPSSHDIRR
jgi:hypothetical protein